MTKAKFANNSNISFVTSNPKRKGSKAAARFAKYCKAKTVVQAVKLGAYRADVIYDTEHGFAKIQAAPAPTVQKPSKTSPKKAPPAAPEPGATVSPALKKGPEFTGSGGFENRVGAA
jgi:hypothetical protein